MGLSGEVLLYIVDDDCGVEGPTELAKVLNVVVPRSTWLNILDWHGMLAVEAMRDCTLLVKCVEYLISVVLLTGREYNDLKVFRHRAQKLFSIRSNVEDHLKGHILQFLL